MRKIVKSLVCVLVILVLLTSCSNAPEENESNTSAAKSTSSPIKNVDLTKEENKYYKLFKESDEVWSKMNEKEKVDMLSKIEWNGFAEVMVSQTAMFITDPSQITEEVLYTLTFTDTYDFSETSKEQSKKILTKLDPLSSSLKKNLQITSLNNIYFEQSNLVLTPKKDKEGLFTIFDVKTQADFINGNQTISYELFYPDVAYSLAKNTFQMKTLEFKKIN